MIVKNSEKPVETNFSLRRVETQKHRMRFPSFPSPPERVFSTVSHGQPPRTRRVPGSPDQSARCPAPCGAQALMRIKPHAQTALLIDCAIYRMGRSSFRIYSSAGGAFWLHLQKNALGNHFRPLPAASHSLTRTFFPSIRMNLLKSDRPSRLPAE